MRRFLSLFTVLMLYGVLASGQTRVVSGTITDDLGAPIPFATITESGTKNAARADEKGNFTINVTGSRLTITAADFRPQVITTTGNTARITLVRSEGQLQAVVVTALGIRRTDKAIGYSIGKVDPNSLLQKSEPDLLKGLQGKVAGVDIRTSQGTPGAATRIQLRGNSSFFGDNQPLIIVDGIPFSNDQVTTTNQVTGGGAYSSGISSLDPNDIASMSVLKGSAAAALYGSRASNGVILISTKSGSAARSKKGMDVTYSTSYSWEKIANLPDYQNEYGTGSQLNAGGGSNGSWGGKFGTIDSVATWGPYQSILGPKVAYRAYPDNVKSLFQTGSVYENSIGLSGGDEKSSVALTASQLNHTGYVPYSSYNRSNVSLGGATKLNNGINVRGNFSYSRSNQKGGFFGENQVDFGSQFARSLFLGRSWNLDLPFEDAQGNNITFIAGQFDNPKWSAKYNRVLTDEERYIGGGHIDFNITKWIKFDYSLGTNINSLSRKEITEISSTTTSAEGKGRLVVEGYRKQEIESNLLLTFTPKINEDFSVRAVIGNNLNQRTTTDQVITGKNFITRGIYNLGNTSQQTFGPIVNGIAQSSQADIYERRRIVGIFADVSLSYRNYAFLEATGRNDWSSTLPVENRSYFYPSLSGSFIFTDAFKLPKNILDFGKIRAGWAKVGRDADPYSLQDIFTIGSNFLGQTTATTGALSAGLPVTYDPHLKPEFTQEIELGTQLTFFKRRIDLDFSWYNRTSTNLIAPISTPASSGYSSFYTNYGKISNKGIEIDLTVKPIVTTNFVWSIHGAFTKNTNIVKELIEGVDRLQLRGVLAGSSNINPYLEPGMPFGYLRGDVSARDSATGALLIDPTSGNMITSSTAGYIGNPNPDFKLGISNTFSYKGVFLNALFDMTKGGDLYTVTVTSLLGRGVTMDTRDRETGWVIPGVYGDPTTEKAILVGGKTVPNQTRITTNDLYFTTGPGGSFGINTASEWNTYDATVYRLREVTIGYDIPKSLFGKLPIGSASISFSGRNLWFIAPNFPRYTNFDPETNSFGATSTQGIELSASPTTKRYGVNLKVTF